MNKNNMRREGFTEDTFDLERTKRAMNNVTLAKRRNRRLNFIIRAAKIAMMLASLGLFLFLFNLAMEVISLI